MSGSRTGARRAGRTVSGASVSAVREVFAAGPIVLDGGLGTLLEQRGNDLRSDLWSARLLAERPEEVVAAHAEFFAAGAQVAISCSYQASFEGFEREGIDARETERLLRRSVELAREAADAADAADASGPSGAARVPNPTGRRLVAASVGPYGAMLADGSEYRGDYGLSVRELRMWHRRRMQVLADSGADLLAIETIPSVAETEAVVAEADRLGVPAWVAVTAASGRLRSGEPLEEAFAIAASAPTIVAAGINCSAPAEVIPALEAAERAGVSRRIAYPNSGETWDAGARRWSGEPRYGDALLDAWLAAGVGAVGGCCRVMPAHIAHIAEGIAQHPTTA
ncbi:homocysteine S-methyltransferase [Planctomonas deserti]|uniref:homocysteine S-methyltransferase n=1 Tax=Planctomonas deserti TaxID=2144185 RepID=UPI000D3ABFB6|nr:homocysteine S-methyltransferase [Planctomonas deserti]